MTLRPPYLTLLTILFASITLSGSKSYLPSHSPQFEARKKQFDAIWQTGQYEKGLTDFQKAAEDAKRSGYIRDELWYLHNLAGCEFGMFQFRKALNTMTQEREIASRIHDLPILAVLGSNMSALYEQMGNLPAAEIAAAEGLKYAEFLAPDKRSLLYAQTGMIQAKSGQQESAEYSFQEALRFARVARNKGVEASVWDEIAYARLQAGRLDDAEAAARSGLSLKSDRLVGGADSSFLLLGGIRARQGNTAEALHFLDRSEEALARPLSRTPPWLVYLRRGQIQMQAGDYRSAIQDLRKALVSVREWRLDVPANDSNRTSSEEKVAELYQSLVECGNRLYLAEGDASLVSETFEAAEENRAASLQALLPRESDWRRRLPPHYYELLARLKAVQAMQMYRGESTPSPALLKLRSELGELEANAGGSAQPPRNHALEKLRALLDDDSIFFSFQVGEEGSWMWAVTNQSLTLYRLPARGILQSRISQFERAAALNRGDPAHLGESFYRMLFSGVPRELVSRQQWLLALDGALFDLPFPALSPSPGRFLIEDHSIQIVPGALILTGGNRPAASGGSFLAVGDPIYNRADPRARERGGWMWPALFARPGSGGGPAFARLWGTAREIQISAIAWKASGPALLTGKDASPENFWKRVGNKPEIIHIATHILEEREQLRAAWIAFSLGSDGRVQYVTPEDISAKSVAAKLVVLSGCGSGKGDVQPATGLMGLTRAWIAAGAGAVLATRWPTVDDDGAFFESFYRNLRQQKPMNPAAALRNASIEMLKSGTWRANPSFWAGYFLIGN